jgi:hypothetical protein
MHVQRVALTAVIAVSLAGCSSPQPASQSTAAPASSKSPAASQAPAQQSPARGARYLADDLPLLPEGLHAAQFPIEVIRASYLFAARHPEVLNYIPCFCGCERSGHKGSHDCFVASRDSQGRVKEWDHHGIECAVCLDVAYTSMQMKNSGASVSAIRAAIDRKFKADGHGHAGTPTPMPPKGTAGASSSGTSER